jgi:hypothetical protein
MLMPIMPRDGFFVFFSSLGAAVAVGAGVSTMGVVGSSVSPMGAADGVGAGVLLVGLLVDGDDGCASGAVVGSKLSEVGASVPLLGGPAGGATGACVAFVPLGAIVSLLAPPIGVGAMVPLLPVLGVGDGVVGVVPLLAEVGALVELVPPPPPPPPPPGAVGADVVVIAPAGAPVVLLAPGAAVGAEVPFGAAEGEAEGASVPCSRRDDL